MAIFAANRRMHGLTLCADEGPSRSNVSPSNETASWRRTIHRRILAAARPAPDNDSTFSRRCGLRLILPEDEQTSPYLQFARGNNNATPRASAPPSRRRARRRRQYLIAADAAAT